MVELGSFPLSQHIRSSSKFPDNSFKGRICQEKNLRAFVGSNNDTFLENVKQRSLTIVANIIGLIYSLYFSYRIRAFVNMQCLSRSSFSAVGGNYRRNILTYREEFLMFLSFVLFNCYDSISIFLFSYLEKNFSSRVIFMLNNLSWLYFLDLSLSFLF